MCILSRLSNISSKSGSVYNGSSATSRRISIWRISSAARSVLSTSQWHLLLSKSLISSGPLQPVKLLWRRKVNAQTPPLRPWRSPLSATRRSVYFALAMKCIRMRNALARFTTFSTWWIMWKTFTWNIYSKMRSSVTIPYTSPRVWFHHFKNHAQVVHGIRLREPRFVG